MGQVQQSEDEQFIEMMNQTVPMLEKLVDMAKTGNFHLKNQRFHQDANSQTLLKQQKEIADNKRLLDDVKRQASSILTMAREEAGKLKDAANLERIEAVNLRNQAEKVLQDAEKTAYMKKEKVKI